MWLKFYKRIKVWDKWLLEHRVIAWEKIWRDLLKTEVVHHIDEDKNNNSPANLMVLVNCSAHASLHQWWKVIDKLDGTFDCIPKETINRFSECISCSKLCQWECCMSCRCQKRSLHIPSKNELLSIYKELQSMVKLWKKFWKSDNGVRKWFIKRWLPTRKRELLEYIYDSMLERSIRRDCKSLG